MTDLAQRIQLGAYAAKGEQRTSDWAPHRAAVRRDESHNRQRLSGLSVLGAFLLFSGITVAVSKGHAGLAESYHISPAGLLGVAWLVQGAAALLCFVLAVRWLRG